jgi:APA family basic amino acid/polyamine antiporter
MASPPRTGGSRLFAKKSVTRIQAEAGRHDLKRTLGPLNLISLGIGAIIGAGIFVITGTAAANHAGPAIMLSFVVAGVACAFAGLCYAEMASTMPVSGSAYTYAYGSMGEVFAWTMGWLLVLEYGVAASTVAVGWAGYLVSFLKDFGIFFPEITVNGVAKPMWATPLITMVEDPATGSQVAEFSGTINLVAALGILAVTALLTIGVSESASVNNVIVIVKVAVLLVFLAVGLSYINPSNWRPFIPEQGATWDQYGVGGIFRAAAIVFFAYVGFEAVSTAAAEAKNPQKDIPFGILGALVVCTLIYMGVAAVLTGIVPYKQLGVPDPIAVAVDMMNPAWAIVPVGFTPSGELNLLSFAIKVGAITGLSSVMLVLAYGQTRIFYTMSRDGLLPRAFSDIHKRFKTPWKGTILLGCLIAVGAAFLPIGVLGDLVSLGTALAFSIVCFSVIALRITHPDMPRPFKLPWGFTIPVLGIVSCLMLAWFNFEPMLAKAARDEPLPLYILGGYVIVGALVYVFYGYRNSKLGRGVEVEEDERLQTAAEAFGHGVDDKRD